MIVLTSLGLSEAVSLMSLLWIWCPDTRVKVSLSITGRMLLVITPNVAAPAVTRSNRDIPEANNTLLLCGVSMHCILCSLSGG